MAKGTAPHSRNLEDANDASFGSAGGWLDHLTFRLVFAILNPFIKFGTLNVRFRDQPPIVMGDETGAPLTVRINRARFLRRMFLSADLAIGEGYMNGEWDMENGDLAALTNMLLASENALLEKPYMKALVGAVHCLMDPHKKNDPKHSRSNVEHHYDIGNDLYSAFLDRGMNYSCAFFEAPDQSLRGAQLNKLQTTLGRLGVEPGMFVLDIGCGWGEMTRVVTEETEAERVIGITLAEEQCKLARERIRPEYDDRLSYLLEDYRDHARRNVGAYDRIVSIGMFEHVGKHHFGDYFQAIQELLKPGGRAVVHSIIRPKPGYTSAWVDKYIFPGGYIPSLDEMTGSATGAGLTLRHDPFIHESFNYANTLRHWRRRFNDSFASLDQSHYDERFRRMWNLYLAGAESSFDVNGFCVSQIVVEKPG